MIPPQDINAEKSVLGAMLLDKQAISETIQILTPDDFYMPEHVKLCEKIYSMYSNNQAVDIVTIGGDITVMTNLTNLVPTTANIKYYAGIVKGKAIRRQYIRAGQEIMQMGYEGEYENITDFKNDVLAKVDIEIKDNKQVKNHIKEVLSETLEKIDKRSREEGGKKMYGIKWLDEKTGGAHDTDLTYLAARPSVGKTAIALQVAKYIASRGNNVALFNLEMSKDQLMERILASEGKIDSQKIRFARGLSDTDWLKINNASENVLKWNMYIFDDLFKIEEIRSACRELKNKNELDFVLVDYLQLCDTMKKTTGINDRVSQISRQFKLMAKEFKVPFWVLSQLSRSNEQENRWPRLIDLRDSGSIEQDADNVFFLYDPNYGKYDSLQNPDISEINFIIGKQRNGARDIFTSLKFHKKVQTFFDN